MAYPLDSLARSVRVMGWISNAVRSPRTARWVSNAIFFVGIPAAIVAGLDIGGQWNVPYWLMYTLALAIALVLVAAIVVLLFGKIE